MKRVKLYSINVLIMFLLFLPFSSVFAKVDSASKTSKFNINGGVMTFELTSKNLDFGQIDITEINDTPGAVTRTAQADSVTVNDARGTFEGYNITVKANQFENEENFKLNEGTLLLDANTITMEGHAKGVHLTRGGNVAIDETTLTMVSVGVGGGYGVNTYTFGSESLKLNIDQKNVKKGNYTTTITYTLNNGPSA